MQRIFFILLFAFTFHIQPADSSPYTRVSTAHDIAEQDFLRAKNLFQIGEINAAATTLESIIASFPSSETAFQSTFFLSEIYLDQKQPEKVRKLLEDKWSNEKDEHRLKRIQELKVRISKVEMTLKEKSVVDSNLPKATPPQVSLPPPTLTPTVPLLEYPVSASTVGLILPLTGPYAVYGERVLIAVQMALAMPVVKFNGQPLMIQTNGKLSLVIGDSKGTIADAEKLVENLVANHHVIAILGDVLVDSAVGVSKKAEALSVVNLSLSRREGLTDIGAWIFRLGLTTSKQTHALVERMLQQSMKKFAILYPTHPYGIEMKESFSKEAKRLGGEITIAVPYQPNETTFMQHVDKLGHRLLEKNADYQTCAQQIKGLSPEVRAKNLEKCKSLVAPTVNFDALFIPDFPKTVSYVLPTLIAQDFLVSQNESIVASYRTKTKNARPIQLLGPSSWNGNLLLERLGNQVQGALFVDGINWANAHPKMSAFMTTYKQLAHSDPALVEAQAYDAACLLRFLLEYPDTKAVIKTRLDLQKALLQTKNFMGLTGAISFDASRDSVIPLSWFTFEKGLLRAL